MTFPTFDEWFRLKSGGATFEEIHQQPWTPINHAMEALTRELRGYTSEMVRQHLTPRPEPVRLAPNPTQSPA